MPLPFSMQAEHDVALNVISNAVETPSMAETTLLLDFKSNIVVTSNRRRRNRAAVIVGRKDDGDREPSCDEAFWNCVPEEADLVRRIGFWVRRGPAGSRGTATMTLPGKTRKQQATPPSTPIDSRSLSSSRFRYKSHTTTDQDTHTTPLSFDHVRESEERNFIVFLKSRQRTKSKQPSWSSAENFNPNGPIAISIPFCLQEYHKYNTATMMLSKSSSRDEVEESNSSRPKPLDAVQKAKEVADLERRLKDLSSTSAATPSPGTAVAIPTPAPGVKPPAAATAGAAGGKNALLVRDTCGKRKKVEGNGPAGMGGSVRDSFFPPFSHPGSIVWYCLSSL
jgi:hypothetical protein